ncbi:sensor histidine kinase [Streptomyces sp. NPDC001480]|uniref:sensor histidine kinase n=1 Tax=Streptomyces sp. NPDC001480 TaxID=3364577 RepID=UPI0036742D9B
MGTAALTYGGQDMRGTADTGRPAGWWRRKSTPEKVETYTRWSFHLFGVIEVAAIGLPVFGQVRAGVAGWLTAMVTVHAVTGCVTASRTLDWTRGRRGRPVRLLWALAILTYVFASVALGLKKYGPGGPGMETAAGTVFAGVLTFGAGTLALGVRRRRRVFAAVLGSVFGASATSFPFGAPLAEVVVMTFVVVIGAGSLATTCLFSVWLLDCVYELDAARETRARLAVAEERLRFGRDLHDVLGRNLSVISLKSELAVQLSRRGRPEAVEQMIEVQRIAQESQREVREVVRGYREADLGVELLGAQGVLTAAGIDCEVTGDADGLPPEVQSALGWVVREATTNVLRHGDAGRCAVGLRAREGSVVLTVENDGVAGPGGSGGAVRSGEGGGSGLAGLRERLAAVDGSLEAGPVGPDGFRLVAEVPLARVTGAAGVSEVAS